MTLVPLTIGGKTAVVHLTRGKQALIDVADVPLVRGRWHVNGRYVAQRRNRKQRLLHRTLLGITDPNIFVDHIDGNGLNCRRSNLRVATTSQNNCNRHGTPRKNRTSRFKGVSKNTEANTYTARICVGGKRLFLGCRRTESQAARLYDKAARIHHGEFAYLNFPDEQAA